ncbi:MAG TPA: DUF2306 domain-containing protein [Thermoanaerobaculia bacterium]|nr:DUF2306 domain-containing protein [Thermoanaerobaculia bacterium]
MGHSILILIHICTATVGLLSGFLAMVLRKGSGMHRIAGNVFFVSMLMMSASAAYLAAFLKPNAMNVVVGLLTFYLVSTGWWAGKRRDGAPGKFELGAMLFAAAVGVGGISVGIDVANTVSRTRNGYPAAMFFVFGSIALLCAASDLRMFVRRELAGTRRMARHLWRMSFALLIATLSFFPGQARNLPESFRETSLVYTPHLFLAASMIYWMIRIRIRKRVRRRAVESEPPIELAA